MHNQRACQVKLPRGGLGQYPSAALKRGWEHFMDCGNLKDCARLGRPVHIRGRDALAASGLVKAGRCIIHSTKTGPTTVIKYFT